MALILESGTDWENILICSFSAIGFQSAWAWTLEISKQKIMLTIALP
jgi:hypothetical protein